MAARKSLASEVESVRAQGEQEARRAAEGYEAQLRAKTGEVTELRKRVQELEAIAEPKRRVLAAAAAAAAQGQEQVVLTGQELRELRQQIAEQEVLLKGYQVGWWIG